MVPLSFRRLENFTSQLMNKMRKTGERPLRNVEYGSTVNNPLSLHHWGAAENVI